MKDPRRFAAALRRLGLSEDLWAGGRQVHGARIRAVLRPSAPREFPATDGLLTDRPGLALRVFAADCVPVFLHDPDSGVIALLHAGWRGVRAKILTRALGLFSRRRGRPARIWVTLGPRIRECCYEVGADVSRFFKPGGRVLRPSIGKPGKFRLDLAAALRAEARRAGVTRFSAAPWCTACDPRFYSYRRDRTDERQAALLALGAR